jgi:3-deoxy-D-manno-octulosonic-acid transferase
MDKLSDRLCLILVPRHPDRSPAIAAALTRDGYRFALRSEGRGLDRDTDLYVADTLGEMGLFLRVADVVVMGGSFSAALEKPPVGGHNPLEPARLGKPAVTGPDMTNWAAVTDHLVQAGGLALVEAPWDLPAALAPLLDNPDAAKSMGERARRAAAEAGSGLDRLLEVLHPLLPPGPIRGRR